MFTRKKGFSLLFVSVLMAFSLAFVSCEVLGEDDDGDLDANESLLVGTWELYSDFGWYKENGQIVDEWDSSIDDDDFEGENLRLVIRANKTGTISFQDDGKWIENEKFEWEYKGGKLYWTSLDGGSSESEVADSMVLDVKELTSTKLVVEFTSKGEYEDIAYGEKGEVISVETGEVEGFSRLTFHKK